MNKKVANALIIIGLFIGTVANVAAAAPQTIVAKDIPALFKTVYGRPPATNERKYWEGRLKDKNTKQALQGAMAWQKSKGKSPKVLGTKSNAIYEMRFSDTVTEAAPGDLVTYSIRVTNKDEEGRALIPGVSVTAKGLEIPAVSDHGKRGQLTTGKLGDTIYWGNTQILNKKAHTFIFQVKTPNKVGSEYCVKAGTFGLPYLQDEDCNTIVKVTKKKVVPTSTPVPTPAVKITSKEFRLLGPDSFSTDRDEQEVTWYSTEALKKKYPNAKIELCPGKDFKGCIILEAVVENDGSHRVTLPPVPRIGKWYLHIIGRTSDDKLIPSVAAARLVTLHQ